MATRQPVGPITSKIISAGTIKTNNITGASISMWPSGHTMQTETLYVKGYSPMAEDMHPGQFTMEDRDGATFVSVVPQDKPGKVHIKTGPEGITLTRPMLDMVVQAMNRGRDYERPRD